MSAVGNTLRGSYQTVWSRPFSPADVDRMCSERFAPGNGDKRSAPYQLGFKNCLNHRLLNIVFHKEPFAVGTAEYDAYYAGVDEAREHARKAKEASAPPAPNLDAMADARAFGAGLTDKHLKPGGAA